MKMKCKSKPILADAVQYIGTNFQEIQKFVPYHVFELKTNLLISIGFNNDIIVETDDFLIKDSFGNLFSCTPEQFKERYEVLVN